MLIGALIAHFFAGTFFCNCIPHLIAGLMGHPFPTPFARPGGEGDSGAMTNFFWGSANMLVVIVLLNYFPLVAGRILDWILFFVGFVLIGAYLSSHFAKVRSHKI